MSQHVRHVLQIVSFPNLLAPFKDRISVVILNITWAVSQGSVPAVLSLVPESARSAVLLFRKWMQSSVSAFVNGCTVFFCKWMSMGQRNVMIIRKSNSSEYLQPKQLKSIIDTDLNFVQRPCVHAKTYRLNTVRPLSMSAQTSLHQQSAPPRCDALARNAIYLRSRIHPDLQ